MADGSPSVRDRILRAARELFLSKGFNGSNLRDIAREANVSMGGIYHHFGSKEEIYDALLPATELAQQMPRIAALFRAPEFPENLSMIGREIFRLVRAHRDDFKLVYIDILEFQGRKVKPMIDALHGAFARTSSGLLSKQTEKGRVVDVHPAVVTRSIVTLFLHFYLEEVMLQNSLAEEIGLTEEEIGDQMAELLLHGIFQGER
jgi:AcrR family transcriptional regulator